MRQIKIKCYEQILERYYQEKHKIKRKRKLIIFVCDGFRNYRNAYTKLFSRTAKLVFGVPIAYKKYKIEHNNNSIERYNREIKRKNLARGIFQTNEGAESTTSLQNIIYNYITPHETLNEKTPAQAAGINLLLGQNKLLNLIKLAKRLEMTIR